MVQLQARKECGLLRMAWIRRGWTIRCWQKVKGPNDYLQPLGMARGLGANCKSSSPWFCSYYRLQKCTNPRATNQGSSGRFCRSRGHWWRKSQSYSKYCWEIIDHSWTHWNWIKIQTNLYFRRRNHNQRGLYHEIQERSFHVSFAHHTLLR